MAAFCFSRMIGLFIGMVAMGVRDDELMLARLNGMLTMGVMDNE